MRPVPDLWRKVLPKYKIKQQWKKSLLWPSILLRASEAAEASGKSLLEDVADVIDGGLDSFFTPKESRRTYSKRHQTI
jgi:hypothetical protein